MSRRSLFAIVILCLAVPAFTQEPAPAVPEAPSVDQLIKRAEETLGTLNDYAGRMIKQERFGAEIQKSIMEFKFQKPFKVYVKYVEPFKGREAIYVPGWNDNEIKVHKGSFPDINVNLDPYGGMAMEGNHHPITHFGLENTIKISAANLRKASERNEGEFKVSDGGTLHGKQVWKIDAKFPLGGINVTAKNDETLWDISKRAGQDMYVILHNNKDLDDPDDPDEGDKVFVPRYYGSRNEFFLDKETGLPVKMSTWDANGRLYECYEYPEVKLNPGLSNQDFNPDNSQYNF